MISALLVTYVWPPTGGVGVGRVLKLSKYLPRHGVKPSVLTVANPSVPLRDESMQKDVDPELEVVLARTFEPSYAAKQAAWASAGAAGPSTQARKGLAARVKGRAVALGKNLLVPDPQILWQPAAQRALVSRLLSARADDVLFVTAPPFSMFLSAPTARALGNTGVVLDYRDEWLTIRTQYEMIGSFSRFVSGPMEALALRSAHFVTTATDAFRASLLEHFPFLDPHRVVTIENGFDPDDFPRDLPEPPRHPAKFVLTYAGTLFIQNSARGLLGALRLLHARAPELAKLLEVRFIGRIVDTELKWFEGSEALGVKRMGYIDKDRIPHALAESHMVLCLLDEMPGAERIYPAKIFELMVIDRPVLTLSPEGALTRLVREHHLGPVLPPRDEAAIAAFLEDALSRFQAGTFETRAGARDIEKFDRRVQAGLFADVFREAAKLRRRQR